MPAKSSCETVYYYTGAVIDNRYALQDFLGEGGMACVYRARELHAPHPYAVKFLKSNFSNNAELLEHFEREAENMKNLAHPNIVRFYDFVHHPDYAYIVMDYIDGFSLSTVLKKLRQREEQLPLDEAVRILTQVARGIDKIHRANFTHRDIKPGNILIAKQDGTAYVADLGIMLDLRDDTLLSLAAGTRAYMPPEQQIGERVDRTADIYAFGILAFELFAGQRPFTANKSLKRDEAENDLIRQHFESPVPSVSQFRSGLPAALDPIIAKALAKKPVDRYQDVLDFARDIHRVLAAQLSEDLQDFSEIRPIKPQESYYAENVVDVPLPTQQRLTPLIIVVGVLVFGLILIIIGGLFSAANNAAVDATANAVAALLQASPTIPTATLTATATATPSATFTSTPTSTPTPTASATSTSSPTQTPTSIPPSPTETTTHTPIPTLASTFTPTPMPVILSTEASTLTNTPTVTPTPTPMPTSILDRADLRSLVTDQAALGLEAGAPLSISPNPNQPLLRLNVGILNGFQVAMTVAGELSEITRYGIAYRIQDHRTYLLFSVQPGENRWQLEQVEDGEATLLQSGETNTAEASTVMVSGQEDVFRINLGAAAISDINGTWRLGGVGLWVEGSTALRLQSLSVSLLGPDARAPRNVLYINAEAMLATGDIVNNSVDCPTYIPLYAGLASYLQIEEVSDVAQELIEVGEYVYRRCEADSPDAPRTFEGGESRELGQWQTDLKAIVDTLSPSG
jgi:serine/threonine-protein kinase